MSISLAGITKATADSSYVGLAAAPTGDPTADTAIVNAAKLSGLTLRAGTYVINPITINSGDRLTGAGHGTTVLKLAAATNAPMVKSANFDTLTLTGSNTAGAANFIIRGVTLDGNASNQSSPAAQAVAIYGYDYQLEDVSIRFFKALDALYTEWGTFGGTGLTEKAMEARFSWLRIHDNTLTGAGWHNRGPHDSMASSVIIYNNTTSAIGYWAEGTGGTYTVAAGSNGVDVSTFAGAGVLNVATTLGVPTAGSGSVVTGSGSRAISWTGTTATTLTGVTATGSGVLSTGAVVTVPSYTGSAALINAMHVWGSHSWAAVLDAGAKMVNCELEGATTGQLLVRGGDCSFSGGRIFYLGSGPGLGVQLGDAANTPSNFELNDPDMTGFSGTSIATAAIYVPGSTSSGSYRAHIFQPTGTAVWGNSIQIYERDGLRFSGGTTFPAVTAAGGLGTSPPAATVSSASDMKHKLSMGTGTTPAVGTAANVTFAQKKLRTPGIMLTPGNAATAALQPYIFNESATGYSIGFAVAPAASQSAGTYVVAVAVEPA